MMVVVRNWRDSAPRVSHLSKIIWNIFSAKGQDGQSHEQAPLEGFSSLSLHMMQSGKEGDSHEHEELEQVYYFTQGHCKMKIADRIYEVREGDAVHIPPGNAHQLINDSDDWVQHLIISARVGPT
jgi:mannose-6-phosphate isomerase-like protein (cupin superfamily)